MKIDYYKIKNAGEKISSIGYVLLITLIVNTIAFYYSLNLFNDNKGLNDIISDSTELIRISKILSFVNGFCIMYSVINLINAGNSLKNIYNDYKVVLNVNNPLLDKYGFVSKNTGQNAYGGIVVCSNVHNTFGLICFPDALEYCSWEEAITISETFEGGGYSDWRLPTSDELLLIYDLIYLRNIAKFRNDYFWSSTQLKNGNVQELNFKDGRLYDFNGNKSNVLLVRTYDLT